jgi:hypothetical protein
MSIALALLAVFALIVVAEIMLLASTVLLTVMLTIATAYAVVHNNVVSLGSYLFKEESL